MVSLNIAVVSTNPTERETVEEFCEYLKRKNHEVAVVSNSKNLGDIFTDPSVDAVLLVGKGTVWNTFFFRYLEMKPLVYLVTDGLKPAKHLHTENKAIVVMDYASAKFSEVEIGLVVAYMIFKSKLKDLVKLRVN